MKKERLLFDLDDVIVENDILKIANEIAGANKRIEDFRHYYIEKEFSFTEEQREIFYDELVNRNLYENAKLIDGAYETLKELLETHDIYIVSDPIIYGREKMSGRLFSDKFNFIMDNLPFINPYNIILCGDKSLVFGKYSVDDKVENLEKENVQHRLLFSAYHNIDIPDEELIKKDIVRVKDHLHVKRFIKGELSKVELIKTVCSVFKLYLKDCNIPYEIYQCINSYGFKENFILIKNDYIIKNSMIKDKLSNEKIAMLERKLQSLVGVYRVHIKIY